MRDEEAEPHGPELIEFLRDQELESIRSEVAAGRREHILKSLDERGRAQELVRQQYTGRYPFELLQNANDASGDETSAGHTARFVLTAEALLVADMGAGFGPSQVRAICGLGRSSKDPRKSIGYKGLGFKSVGEITDEPQIFSRDLCFRFNESVVRHEVSQIAGELDEHQRLPVYAFPLPVSRDEVGSDQFVVDRLLADGFRTVFRLPFKPEVSPTEVADHLEATLLPRLLLFLDATTRLELIGTSADFTAEAVREEQGDHVEMLLEASGSTEHWLVFDRELEVADPSLVAPLGDAWREVDRVRVACAVPLSESGAPTRLDPQPIHVYFPTQEPSGMGLLLQADFALELDRRRIAASPEARRFNGWLAQELGDLVGTDVASGLVARFPQSAAVVSALSVVHAAAGIGAEIVRCATSALASQKFVPTISGEPRLPTEALLLPKSVPDATAAHSFLDVETDLGPLVLPAIEDDHAARGLLVNHLGTTELTLQDAAARVGPPPDELVHDFYEFLVDWSESAGSRSLAGALAEVRCVRTVSGTWHSPDERLFFPRQREEVDFPDGLEVPITDVPDVDGLRPLLETAGVSSFEWRQLLPEFIFPLLTDPDVDPVTRKLGLQALRLYYRTERSGDPRLRSQAARVLVPAVRSDGSDERLVPAESCYFSEGWLGRDHLEVIYGPFGASEFLSQEPPEDADERATELEFLEWLGVASHPRPDPRVVEQRDIHMVNALSRHPHGRYGEHWTSWLGRPDVRAASRCSQGHSASQQLRVSYGLDRFPELTQCGERDRLSQLWEELARNWGTYYQEAQSALFYCQNSSHGGERTASAPSLLRHLLDELEWVPSHRRGQVELVQPGQAWRVTRDIPRRVVERVPALPADLDRPWASGICADLGVVDAARPQPLHLVELLSGLEAEWDGVDQEAGDARSIVDAARWTMRTLNDVLADEPNALDDVDVPLLARRDGRRVFVQRPYVADDTFLAETWEPVLPILDADRDLRQLHGALNLPSLDRQTEKIPVPLGLNDEAQESVRADVAKALPFLASVAVEAVPSRSDDVFRGLARLELAICDDLIVRYELDGEVRERTEAVAFIAVRQEQEGIIRRNIGTAHLELDPGTGAPHWYVFGPLLARFLNVPTQGDAFALLLSGSDTSRREYLRSRLISAEELEEARIRLDQPPPDDTLQGLVGEIDVDGSDGDTDEVSDRKDVADDGGDTDKRGGEGEPDAPVADDDEPLPPINHDAVVVDDGEVGRGAGTSKGGGRGGGGGLGPEGPVDHERRQRLQRTIGHRGEEAVVEAERRRLTLRGQDPDRVVWRSKTRPFAPYDVESIDDDGQTMYIEVKSTSGDDPYDAFEISHAELMWALNHRSRYFVFRVTDAHTSTPLITRFQDPFAMLRDGSAELGLSGARLGFCRPAQDS